MDAEGGSGGGRGPTDPLVFGPPTGPDARFQAGDPAAVAYLQEHGYVVIAAVLTQAEVNEAIDLFWTWYETVTAGAVRRDDPGTWRAPAWLGNAGNGIFAKAGIGQSPFLWFVRTRPPVLRAFADVWGEAEVRDMLVSFDGCNAFRPPSVQRHWRTRGGWFHTDQNGCTTGSDFKCAQGLVTLYDQDMATGGLAVVPGTHRHHAEVFQRWPLKRKNDFFIVPQEDPLYSVSPRLVQARAGDLIIWDSRCLHCNVPGRHRFDEVSLTKALRAAGLPPEAAEPMTGMFPGHFPSVADGIWMYQELRSQGGDDLVVGQAQMLGVPAEHCEAVAARLSKWSDELAEDLQAAGASASGSGAARLSRLVAYVCALPRRAASPEVLQARVEAAVRCATTTHWPDRVVLGAQHCRPDFTPLPGAADPLRHGELALQLIGCKLGIAAAMRGEIAATRARLQAMATGAASRSSHGASSSEQAGEGAEEEAEEEEEEEEDQEEEQDPDRKRPRPNAEGHAELKTQL